jgi:hypothetical protein
VLEDDGLVEQVLCTLSGCFVNGKVAHDVINEYRAAVRERLK